MDEMTEIKEKVEEGIGEPEKEPEPEAVPNPEEPEEGSQAPEAQEPEAQAESGEGEGEPALGEGQPAAEANPEAPLEGNPTSENGEGIAPEPEKPIFTQEQVNKMAGKSREEGRKAGYKAGYDAAMAELLEKYGVENNDELDGLFADGSRYGEQMARYDDMGRRLKDSETTVALMKCGILPERYSDVKAILNANGLDVTEEAIKSMLPTHGEWVAAQQAQEGNPVAPAPEIPQPKPEGETPEGQSAGVMGAEPKAGGAEPEESEEEQAMRVFGIKR